MVEAQVEAQVEAGQGGLHLNKCDPNKCHFTPKEFQGSEAVDEPSIGYFFGSCRTQVENQVVNLQYLKLYDA
jgi:hypothetical protein